MDTDCRKVPNKLLDMVDEGMLDARTLALACLKYMSEDDVKDMARSNEFLEEEEEEPEESFSYLVFVGNRKDDMQPYLAFPDDTAAIDGAKNALNFYNYTEAVYMPEDDVDTNEVIWRSWEVHKK